MSLIPGLQDSQTPGRRKPRKKNDDDSFLDKLGNFFRAGAPTGAAATGAIAAGVPKRRGYQPPVANEPQPAAPFKSPLSGFRFAGDKGYINQDEQDQKSNTAALPPNFLEYLSRFSSSSQPDLSAFDAQEAELRRRAAEGQTAIGGLYGSLAKQLAAQVPTINQTYTDAQGQVQQSADQTTQAIQAGGAAANAQRAALLKALGMEDQVNSNVAQEAQADMIDATSDAALARQGTGNLLTTNQTTQRDLNSANQTASLQRGTQEQAGLQSQLLAALSDLSGQRANARSEASQQNFDLAKLLYDADSQNFYRDREFSAGRDDEMWNRALEDRRLQSGAPTPREDKAVTAQIQARMRADRVPNSAQQAIMDMIMSGDAVNDIGRATITPELIESYGLDPKKYTPSYIGQHAFEFWRAYQK